VTLHVGLKLVRGVERNFTNFTPDVPGGLEGPELGALLLQLPHHCGRLHLSSVAAANEMMLQYAT
jgi:hypothetical protein